MSSTTKSTFCWVNFSATLHSPFPYFLHQQKRVRFFQRKLVKSQNKELASMQPYIKPYPFHSRLACVCDMLVNLKLAAGGKKSLFPDEFDICNCAERRCPMIGCRRVSVNSTSSWAALTHTSCRLDIAKCLANSNITTNSTNSTDSTSSTNIALQIQTL